MQSIETSLRNFELLMTRPTEYFDSDYSEADTRSKIIDTLFISVLGWNENEIKREGYLRQAGYYDYYIGVPSFHFIVEAKRVRKQFTFPVGQRKCKLAVLYKELAEEFEQLRKYIFEKSVSYGVLTNGSQLIVAKFNNTDGSSWLDNTAVIFNGLEDIERRFTEFYNLLSKSAISINNCIRFENEYAFYKTITAYENLAHKGEELVRNTFSEKIALLVEILFKEFDSNSSYYSQFLKSCYVKNEDIEKHYKEVDIIFGDDSPRFHSTILPIKNSDKTMGDIKSKVVEPTSTVKPTPQPVLIIGGKGSGKTTFIKYLKEFVIDSEMKKNRPLVYLDFRGFTEQMVKDSNQIVKAIVSALKNENENLKLDDYNILCKVYKKEIDVNKRSIWSYINSEEKLKEKISEFLEKEINDSLNHFVKINEYLIFTCQKRLTVVFDNVDQLGDDVQREIFLLANSLREKARIFVILSLREGYYYQWKSKPPFDAYQPTVYHISASSFSKIPSIRIEFLLTHFGEGLEPPVINLFRNLNHSLFESGDDSIIKFMEQTSFPDVRSGLEKFNTFLLSGHTKLADYSNEDYRKIPFWEFLKAVALKSSYYYFSSKSLVFNLFYPDDFSKTYFTTLKILDYLFEFRSSQSANEGFVDLSKVLSEFTLIGFNEKALSKIFVSLLSAGLIESDSYIGDTSGNDLTAINAIRISQRGCYYLKTLVYDFQYYDLIVQDTPISDRDVFDAMIQDFPFPDNNGAKDLKKRIAVVNILRKYLEKREKSENENIDFLSISSNVNQNFVGGINKSLEGKIRELVSLS